MTFAFGRLKWTPDTFWNSTFYELSCAYWGWCLDSGLVTKGAFKGPEDIEQFREFVDAMKERFPDGKLPKAEKRALREARI